MLRVFDTDIYRHVHPASGLVNQLRLRVTERFLVFSYVTGGKLSCSRFELKGERGKRQLQFTALLFALRWRSSATFVGLVCWHVCLYVREVAGVPISKRLH